MNIDAVDAVQGRILCEKLAMDFAVFAVGSSAYSGGFDRGDHIWRQSLVDRFKAEKISNTSEIVTVWIVWMTVPLADGSSAFDNEGDVLAVGERLNERLVHRQVVVVEHVRNHTTVKATDIVLHYAGNEVESLWTLALSDIGRDLYVQ